MLDWIKQLPFCEKIGYNKTKIEEFYMKKNVAFTLAEMMITLLIIGIVATMMITNLMDASPDENALMYKKAFYSISEIISSLTNDSTKFPDGENMFKAEITTETGITDPQEYFCTEVANGLNTLGDISCDEERDGNTNISGDNYDFKLANGTLVAGLNQEFTDEDGKSITPDTITICVDVNGDKGPNAGCSDDDEARAATDRDQFRIRISYDGKVSTGNDDEGFAVENAILGGSAIPTTR